MATNWIQYPLQGTKFDISIEDVLQYKVDSRRKYLLNVFKALRKVIHEDEMALKNVVRFKREIQDYRLLIRKPTDAHLLTDDEKFERTVLGLKTPGEAHTYHSRQQMWKMRTKQGSLKDLIVSSDEKLLKLLEKLVDPNNEGKAVFRKSGKPALRIIFSYLEMNFSVGAAFPPFHARFLADKFLPEQGDCIVVDPCAGWGGRLLGTICVPRNSFVKYIGIDPEIKNQNAYGALQGIYYKYLKQETKVERASKVYVAQFEKWIKSAVAKKMKGQVDLVMTSPPYFDAENYNPENKWQSANTFQNYSEWREKFYSVLIQGAFDLLKPKGIFVLNVANVKSAMTLEADAIQIAKSVGFKKIKTYKLAMSETPGAKGKFKNSVTVGGKRFKFEPVFCFIKP